jgi:predicted porin
VKNLGGTPSTAKATGYTLGASIPVSASGTAMVAYGSVKIKPVSPAPKASMFSVGYEQSLSKRTSVYIAANHVKTKNLGLAPNENGRNYAVGIKHNF